MGARSGEMKDKPLNNVGVGVGVYCIVMSQAMKINELEVSGC